jgi:hypothetical protein
VDALRGEDAQAAAHSEIALWLGGRFGARIGSALLLRGEAVA